MDGFLRALEGASAGGGGEGVYADLSALLGAATESLALALSSDLVLYSSTPMLWAICPSSGGFLWAWPCHSAPGALSLPDTEDPEGVTP